MKLYEHQLKVLNETKDYNKVGYFLDMGLGKTFVAGEKLIQLQNNINLIVCQKSMIEMWINHFKTYYGKKCYLVSYDLTNKKEYDAFLKHTSEINEVEYLYDEWTGQTYQDESFDPSIIIGVINYELIFRRKELLDLNDFTLLLDESSLISNEKAKRSKFILKMQPRNVILLSGTLCNGKYEKLWSQLHLLGWDISKELYERQYVNYEINVDQGFPIKTVKGYKNVERLKRKLKEHGAIFMKTDEVLNLPEQIFNDILVSSTKEYIKFKKTSIATVDGKEFVGDVTLSKMLYERMLCGSYNKEKLNCLKDLLESTDDRVIIFYNFNEELWSIQKICEELNRQVCIINGEYKNLTVYETINNSVTLVQYQAGSLGLNLQLSNKMIYFTPPLSSDYWMQSSKRINRIGQEKTCYYYKLICKNSIEEKIYAALYKGVDYTNKLFEKGE